MTYEQTDQLWISLWVGADVLPLLANLCSKDCEYKLPKPPQRCVQFPHKGGTDLKQPTYYVEGEGLNVVELIIGGIVRLKQKVTGGKPKLFKKIGKIWEK